DRGCHTPRRNKDVAAALRAFEEIDAFGAAACGYFFGELFPVQQGHTWDLGAINADQVFVPVLPLFEGSPSSAAGDGGALPAAYAHAFLEEERRSLAEKCRALSTAFPRDGTAITAVEAGLLVTLQHARKVCEAYADAVDYVEAMLRRQLADAIGKELSAADF